MQACAGKPRARGMELGPFDSAPREFRDRAIARETEIMLTIYVCDSDGNALDPGECTNMDDAIHVAAHYALDVWPDYERAEILLSSDDEKEGGHSLAFVERVGCGTPFERNAAIDRAVGELTLGSHRSWICIVPRSVAIAAGLLS